MSSFRIGIAGEYLGFWLHGGHDPAVVEQLAPNTYLAFSGIASAAVTGPEPSTISAAFTGSIEYCVVPAGMGHIYNCGASNSTGEPLPGAAVARVPANRPTTASS